MFSPAVPWGWGVLGLRWAAIKEISLSKALRTPRRSDEHRSAKRNLHRHKSLHKNSFAKKKKTLLIQALGWLIEPVHCFASDCIKNGNEWKHQRCKHELFSLLGQFPLRWPLIPSLSLLPYEHLFSKIHVFFLFHYIRGSKRFVIDGVQFKWSLIK